MRGGKDRRVERIEERRQEETLGGGDEGRFEETWEESAGYIRKRR